MASELDAGAQYQLVSDAIPEEASGLQHAAPAADGRFVEVSGGLSLRRTLTLFDGISIMVGIVMGSGIFASPGVVMADVGSVGISLLVWAAAGVVAYSSSLVYAELGSAIPHAGGDGEYLRIAFGEAVSFMFTWTFFFVMCGGGNAIVALTCARYLGSLVLEFMGLDSNGAEGAAIIKAISIAIIVFLTLVNCLGVRVGSWLQNLLNVTKVILVCLIVAAALVFVARDTTVAAENVRRPFDGTTWSHLGSGFIAALWAFDGWSCIVFLSEELARPASDLPRCVMAAMSTVAAVFVVMNVAYLCILPAEDVKQSQVIAVLAVSKSLGAWAGRATALLVAINVLGCANGAIMSTSRYLYAAARQGQLPKQLATVSSNGAPAAALLADGAWTSVVLAVSSNNLEKLLDYFGIASWVFYGLVATALIKLRRDLPNLHRPFIVKNYPAVPLLLILISIYLVCESLISSPVASLASLGSILLGLPVYYLLFRRRSSVKTPLLH